MIDLQSLILIYVSNFSYLGIFLLLIIIALIPVPEELVLILVGYFASYGFAEADKVAIISVLGVIIGDNILYFLSRHGSNYINKLKKISPKRFAKYEKHMNSHIGKTIFLLRFIIGLRFLSPVIAGSSKVPWSKFFFFNFLAVIIFVPVFIYLGYHFNTLLSIIITKVLLVKNFVIGLVFLLILIYLYYILKKKFFKKFKNNETQK